MLRNILNHRNVRLLCQTRHFSDTTNISSSPSPSTSTPTTTTANAPQSEPHIPVMVKELIRILKPAEGATYIDMTFGSGGHSRRILKAAPNIKIIAIDRDPNAFKYAEKLRDEYPGQVIPLCGRFSELPALLADAKVDKGSIDGAIFDLGCSSMQLEEPLRGFSPLINGPLDMRMDGNRFPDEPTVADVLATIDEEDLYKIIKVYGKEKKARKIVRSIIDSRYAMLPIRTTHHLADIVATSLKHENLNESPNRSLAAVARTFRALRIFANNELNEINYGMQLINHFVKVDGRLVVITYNQLEDTIVKRHISGHVIQGVVNMLPLKFFSSLESYDQKHLDTFMASEWHPLFKHVIVPTDREVDLNPMSRFAKLRAASKVQTTQ